MAVEKSLQSLSGVTNAEVDLVANIVKIAYDMGKVNLDDLERAITDAGYEVVK